MIKVKIWYNQGMIDFYTTKDSTIPMSMRALRDALKRRGWKAEKLCAESETDVILTRPDGKVIKIAACTPPNVSYYAIQLADNKLMSHELLKSIGVNQPETVPVRRPEDARDLLEKYGKIIVKPVDGAHGRGFTGGITSFEQLTGAVELAKAASPQLKIVIAQPQLPLDELELRIICIDYQFVTAIARIPAHATGDGQHTIAELVDIENRTIRKAPYQGDLAYINPEAAKSFLGQKIQDVPQAGERVRVVASCNVGQGGTAEDYSDKISGEIKTMAEKIARTAELPVIGIDLYGDQVIEINARPSLYYPTGDAGATKAVEAYIDYLTTL